MRHKAGACIHGNGGCAFSPIQPFSNYARPHGFDQTAKRSVTTEHSTVKF